MSGAENFEISVREDIRDAIREDRINHPVLNRENLPVFGLTVGMAAFAFQTLVLFPWHEILGNKIDQLEVVTRRMEVLEMKLDEKMDLLLGDKALRVK